MALSGNLTLSASNGADTSFHEITRDATGVVRADVSRTADMPQTLSIKHSVSGKGAAAIRRHLIQVSNTTSDGTPAGTGTAVVNLTIQQPSMFDPADFADMICYVVELLTGGFSASTGVTDTTLANLKAILRGES